MKYSKKIGVLILSICMMVSMFGVTSQAASGSISISSASGKVGSTVTITGTAKCDTGAIGAAEAVFSYDPSALEFVGGSNVGGGSGSVSYAGFTPDGVTNSLGFSMEFKILKEGNHVISSGNAEIYNIDEELLSVRGASATITGKAVTSNSGGSQTSGGGNSTGNSGTSGGGNGTGNNGNSSTNNDTEPKEDKKDTNNKLNSLKVSPGTLTPAFSADTTSYTVTVPDDTTEVVISATAQSSKAKVTVSGGKDLKLGPNTAKVVVMAENDTAKTYQLTIMCGEQEKIQLDGVEHTINEGFKDEEIPTGFVREKATYKEREYEALIQEKGTIRLFNLQSESGSAFYIYNQETQEFYPFTQIEIAKGKYIMPLPLRENVSQFAALPQMVLNLQEGTVNAWKLDEERSIICAANQEGEELLYQYDNVDGTFQRYAEAAMEEPVSQGEPEIENPLQKYYLYIITGLGVLSAILLIVTICLIATRKKNHKARRRKLQRKLKRQEEHDEL